MKINKLILPIITIISLSSCSKPIVENSSYITDKEEVQKQIVNILDASATKAQSDTYGLDVSSTRGEIIKFNMNDNGKITKIEGSISPFSLYLAVNNLSGNKEEAKFGLTSSGLNISAKSIFPEDFEYRPFDYRVSTGETSIYFMNGTLYADLSKSNLKSVILNAAESYLPSVISQGSVYKEIIDNTLGDMRIKFEASTLPFPVVKTSEAKNVDYNQLVSDGLRWIDEASLNWLDYIKLYENKDGTAQFDVNIDKPSLQKILDSQKDNLEGTDRKSVV